MLGRLYSVFFPILPFSCTSNIIQSLLKWKMFFHQLQQASAQAPSMCMCPFLPNAATPAQTQHVWRLLAHTACLFPTQLRATWPRASRLECWPLLGWMWVSFQSASISTLSMCSFSPDRCSPVPDASGAHLQLQAPLPPVMHTQTHVCVCRAMCISWLCFNKQKIKKKKKVGTSALICRDRIPELISHQHLIHLPVLSSKYNDSLFASKKSNKKKKIYIY